MYSLLADQLVPSSSYRVITAGDYAASALVECYLDGDETKKSLAAFPAEYVATGQITEPGAPVTIDVGGFETALWQDTDLPSAVRLAIAQLYPLIRINLDKPQQLQEGWLALQGVYGSSWLTAGVKAKVEHYAQQYGLPIVGE